jgi:hypothetical protein
MTERADVSPGIAVHAEQDKSSVDIKNFKLPYFADAQGALNRALPWRALVQPPGELYGHLLDMFTIHVVVKPHEAYIFLVMLEEERGKTHRIAEHD